MLTSTRPEPRIARFDPADVQAFVDIDNWAFAQDLDGVDQGALLARFEWDRSRGAYLPDLDGVEQLAGINSVYSLDLPVPGGSIACAGLTWVGVHPGFRRRGVLTTMIRDHLAAVRERGEPVSALKASETTIYGRYGYGTASRHLQATIRRGAALRDVPGSERVRLRFESADADRHADLVGDCYQAARQGRPGMVSRNSPALRRAELFDPPQWREGAEQLRILIAEPDSDGGDGIARGYALFQRKERWDGQLSKSTVAVRELVARDPAAARALWGRVLDLDLTVSVETDDRATDDPLWHLLLDPRTPRPVLGDGLWVRLVDLPTALAARRYGTNLDVVIEVRDELCPWNAGRWRLSGGTDEATCTPSHDPAAFSIDVRELGAAYLGSTSLDSLAAAGLISVTDPAGWAGLATASRAFSWPVAAYCGWTF
jgi:predicted acetyltransferase